jgi:hypothetical protein
MLVQLSHAPISANIIVAAYEAGHHVIGDTAKFFSTRHTCLLNCSFQNQKGREVAKIGSDMQAKNNLTYCHPGQCAGIPRRIEGYIRVEVQHLRCAACGMTKSLN